MGLPGAGHFSASHRNDTLRRPSFITEAPRDGALTVPTLISRCARSAPWTHAHSVLIYLNSLSCLNLTCSGQGDAHHLRTTPNGPASPPSRRRIAATLIRRSPHGVLLPCGLTSRLLLSRSHRWAGRAASFPTPYPIVTLRLRRCLLSAYRSSPSCDVHSRRASERSARPCPHIASFTRSAELAGESCRLAQRRSHALGGKVTCLRSAACWAVSPPLYFFLF